MNLQEILTEKITKWEEGVISALFLNSISVEELALDSGSKKKIGMYLAVLSTLPWPYAKEICYSISRSDEC